MIPLHDLPRATLHFRRPFLRAPNFSWLELPVHVAVLASLSIGGLSGLLAGGILGFAMGTWRPLLVAGLTVVPVWAVTALCLRRAARAHAITRWRARLAE